MRGKQPDRHGVFSRPCSTHSMDLGSIGDPKPPTADVGDIGRLDAVKVTPLHAAGPRDQLQAPLGDASFSSTATVEARQSDMDACTLALCDLRPLEGMKVAHLQTQLGDGQGSPRTAAASSSADLASDAGTMQPAQGPPAFESPTDVAEADFVTGPSLLATKRKEPPSSVGHAACRMRCCAADGVAAPAEHLHPPLGKTSGMPANGRASA